MYIYTYNYRCIKHVYIMDIMLMHIFPNKSNTVTELVTRTLHH